MGSITKDYDLSDFQCHCDACKSIPDRPATTPEMIQIVQKMRNDLNMPLIVTRGVSCEAHNKAIGGAPDSRHLPQHRDAIDVATKNATVAWHIVAWLMANGLYTIRVYSAHVHFDGRPDGALFLASPE